MGESVAGVTYPENRGTEPIDLFCMGGASQESRER